MSILSAALLLILAGCSREELLEKKAYQLKTGEVVRCTWAETRECGIDLIDCDGRENIRCATDVQEL